MPPKKVKSKLPMPDPKVPVKKKKPYAPAAGGVRG
jgi:hypothetical protein